MTTKNEEREIPSADEFCPYCMSRVRPGETCPVCGLTQGAYTPAPYHVPPGTVLMGRYLIGRVLGDGGLADLDARRKQTVQGLLEFPVRNVRGRRRLEGSRHAKRMNPGIRPAAALDPDGIVVEEMPELFLQHFLNGDAVGLALPAVIIRAVKTQLETESSDPGEVFCFHDA